MQMDGEAYICWYLAKRMMMDWNWLSLAASDPGSCSLATFVCFRLQDQSNWPALQLLVADTPPLAGITQWTPGVNKGQDGWINKCPLSFIDRRVLSSACKGSLSVLVCVCVFVTHKDLFVGERKGQALCVCIYEASRGALVNIWLGGKAQTEELPWSLALGAKRQQRIKLIQLTWLVFFFFFVKFRTIQSHPK